MTKVAVLGTGLMGSGMARSLARSGLTVTAWNRTTAKARPLADAGIEVAEDVESAVRGADAVVTMLFDADAVEQVMQQALAAMGAESVWAQCATVGRTVPRASPDWPNGMPCLTSTRLCSALASLRSRGG